MDLSAVHILMAPRTRAAKARAAAAAEVTCLLLDLSHDEQSIVTHELCDPLRPLLAVHLSSTAKGLWVPMQEQLAELRQRHAEAAAMARAWGMSCAALADATELVLGAHPAYDKPLTLAQIQILTQIPYRYLYLYLYLYSPTGGRWGCWWAAARCRGS